MGHLSQKRPDQTIYTETHAHEIINVEIFTLVLKNLCISAYESGGLLGTRVPVFKHQHAIFWDTNKKILS